MREVNRKGHLKHYHKGTKAQRETGKTFLLWSPDRRLWSPLVFFAPSAFLRANRSGGLGWIMPYKIEARGRLILENVWIDEESPRPRPGFVH